MQNIVINMCEKFHNDQLRLRNDTALVHWKSDNNNTKKKHNYNYVGSAWGLVSGSENDRILVNRFYR